MDVLPLGLVGDGALRAAVAADREVAVMEGVRMDHLAQYLRECSEDWVAPTTRVPGVEQLIALAGPGAPRVPEFAVCEVAAALGLSQASATGLCADVLDLVNRLPRVAAAVRCGELTFVRARMIARRTRELGKEQASLVQASVMRSRATARGPVPLASRVSMGRLRSLIDQAVLTARGPESLAEAEARVAESLFVELVRSADGGTDIAARLATSDAARLDARLDQVAVWLAQVGDTRPKAVLRAVALGLLADPVMLKALDGLRRERVVTETPAASRVGSGPRERGAGDGGDASADDHAHDGRPTGDELGPIPGSEDQIRDLSEVGELLATAAPPPDLYLLPQAGGPELGLGPPGAPHLHGRDDPGGSWRAGPDHDPPRRAGVAGMPDEVLEKFAGLRSTVLYVHLDKTSGTWCEERAGAISQEEARAIVGHSRVSVRPVLDLAEELSYTGYVAPPRLREQLSMLNAGLCTFPFCERRARPGDVDHQIPDPRGRRGWANGDDELREGDGRGTRSSNTHLLCRKHHRAKTHGGWRVAEPTPGVWVWRSPAGAHHLVTNGTTTMLNGLLETEAAVAPGDLTLREHEVTHGFAEVG